MTSPTDRSARRDSDLLTDHLKTLKEAPFHQRGEAALRLAAVTIAALRRLETRIETLEAITDAD